MQEHARAEMLAALQGALTKQERDLFPAHTPMPTVAEMRAALDRMANPTPAERAAEMLNARLGKRPPALALSVDWEDFTTSGDRRLQAVVSVRRVQRTAPRYWMPEPDRATQIAEDLRRALHAAWNSRIPYDGTEHFRYPGTIRAFSMTQTIK
jgi:hypothetical protein